jgi:hypothetical protein
VWEREREAVARGGATQRALPKKAGGWAVGLPKGKGVSKMEEATAAHRPLEMETASRRQSAATRMRGSIGSAEIFAEGTVYTTTKRGVHRAGLAGYRQGVVRGGRLAENLPTRRILSKEISRKKTNDEDYHYHCSN